MPARTKMTVESTARERFAARLREAMLDADYPAKKRAAHGVDVVPLMAVANVTREAARKYVTGKSLPDEERIVRIAEWLDVRLAWLRDGEGEKRDAPERKPGDPHVAQESAVYSSAEAAELAALVLRLPPERRAQFRDLLALAALAAREPWLRMGQFDPGETFEEYERRIVRSYRIFPLPARRIDRRR